MSKFFRPIRRDILWLETHDDRVQSILPINNIEGECTLTTPLEHYNTTSCWIYDRIEAEHAFYCLLDNIEKKGMKKECFVTTGATAKFTDLIQATLTEASLQAFADNGFTHITIQCGNSLAEYETLKPADTKGLNIRAFDFNKNGLNKEMRACQAVVKRFEEASVQVSEKGLCICHAGSGTILDAMRLGLTMIVVPNSSLLDNHQEELADELESQGYVTKSDTQHLAQAIKTACLKDQKIWGGHTSNFPQMIDKVVGFEDDVGARLD